MSLHRIVNIVNKDLHEQDLDSLLSFNMTQHRCSVVSNMPEVLLSYSSLDSEKPTDEDILEHFISEVEYRLSHLYDIRESLLIQKSQLLKE